MNTIVQYRPLTIWSHFSNILLIDIMQLAIEWGFEGSSVSSKPQMCSTIAMVVLSATMSYILTILSLLCSMQYGVTLLQLGHCYAESNIVLHCCNLVIVLLLQYCITLFQLDHCCANTILCYIVALVIVMVNRPLCYSDSTWSVLCRMQYCVT